MSRGSPTPAPAPDRFGSPHPLGAVTALLLALALNGCGPDPGPAAPGHPPVRVNPQATRPAALLSEYRLFTDARGRVPNQGVIPYGLNTSHFADYARSRHFVYVPPGTQATYHETDPFVLPVGSVLIQNLAFPERMCDATAPQRLVETRLLLHLAKGWVAVAYLWDEQGTDARRAVVGGKTTVRWIEANDKERTHEWVTPDMNQCKRCHVGQGETGPIGIRARNLNRPYPGASRADNQLIRWRELGILNGAPTDPATAPRAPVWNDPLTGSIDERARTWLDVNCAHCHNPKGPASVSGLDLTIHQKIPAKYGVYKPPVAAGRGSRGSRFSIDPGNSEDSFLLHRIRSKDPGIMMPTLGRGLVDEEGAILIEQWIQRMQPDAGQAARALDPVEAYQDALHSGDAERGQALFHAEAQCVVCHTADRPNGGTIGPSLEDIGSRATRQELLESLLLPSAVLARGYAATTLTLNTGEILLGRIASEDVYELVLATPDGATRSIPTETIRARETSPASIMPSMAAMLPVKDVQDLIEYLASCRGAGGNPERR